jgi:transposase InsO family protein
MFPVKQTTSIAAIRALQTGILSSFSVPEVIVSDNAQCFVSRDFKNFCFGLGIKHVTTSPYYPQPSHAARFNRNMRAALIAYHSDAQETWDKQLGSLQLAFNTADHQSTKNTVCCYLSFSV